MIKTYQEHGPLKCFSRWLMAVAVSLTTMNAVAAWPTAGMPYGFAAPVPWSPLAPGYMPPPMYRPGYAGGMIPPGFSPPWLRGMPGPYLAGGPRPIYPTHRLPAFADPLISPWNRPVAPNYRGLAAQRTSWGLQSPRVPRVVQVPAGRMSNPFPATGVQHNPDTVTGIAPRGMGVPGPNSYRFRESRRPEGAPFVYRFKGRDWRFRPAPEVAARNDGWRPLRRPAQVMPTPAMMQPGPMFAPSPAVFAHPYVPGAMPVAMMIPWGGVPAQISRPAYAGHQPVQWVTGAATVANGVLYAPSTMATAFGQMGYDSGLSRRFAG